MSSSGLVANRGAIASPLAMFLSPTTTQYTLTNSYRVLWKSHLILSQTRTIYDVFCMPTIIIPLAIVTTILVIELHYAKLLNLYLLYCEEFTILFITKAELELRLTY